jgi:hypothetical protein
VYEGEVRVDELTCDWQEVAQGDAVEGDWVLENSLIRYVVKGPETALTLLGRAGGTVLDVARPGENDVLLEVIPLVDGDWFTDVVLTPFEEVDDDGNPIAGLTVEGTLPDDSQATVVYSLGPYWPTLKLEGNDSLVVRPLEGLERHGRVLELTDEHTVGQGNELLVGVDGNLEDLGGWLEYTSAQRMVVGDRQTVHQVLWHGVDTASGTAEGEWVQALIAGEVVARLPVIDGEFDGVVPQGTQAVWSIQDGYGHGDAVQPTSGLELELGDFGSVKVRLTDVEGQDMSGIVSWNGRDWTLPTGGGTVLTGPGVADLWVHAGPAYEPTLLESYEIRGEQTVWVRLEPIGTPGVLADVTLPGWPDATERRSADELLSEATARGVDYVVVTAEDEVAQLDPGERVAGQILARAGSRSGSNQGHPLAWPWNANSKRSGHGAVDWTLFDAVDLLAVMSDSGDRIVAVDSAWVESAGHSGNWDPRPDLFLLEDFDDLSTYVALLDQWVPASAVGPLTWVDGVDLEAYAEVDVESRMLQGQTTATNGPRLLLEVDGLEPGEYREAIGPLRVHLRLEAPTVLDLDAASLVGPGGEVLVVWPLSGDDPVRLDTSTTIGPVDWVIAVCSGSQDGAPITDGAPWAVTSPVWLGRP